MKVVDVENSFNDDSPQQKPPLQQNNKKRITLVPMNR